ncbi:MAG: NAD-dependent epimerase/dehydratase family protein [Burkholderiales bacterium]
MRILVTGASGFSGRHVAHALARAGHAVTAVLGPDGASRARALEGAPFACIAADLADGIDLPDALDAVVHAAARSAWPGVGVDDMVRDNVVATRRLVDSARRAGARSFVLFSSLSVHGRIDVPVVDERTPIVDPDAYGITKRLCELMLEEAAAQGLRALALRLPGVLGPGSVRNWLTTSLAAAREGRDLTVSDPDAPFNNAVHVDDLARFIERVLVSGWDGFDAFPLGAAGQLSAGEVARMLAQAGGRGSRVVQGGPPRRGYVISSAHAQERHGYAPMEIGAMLRRFVAENA